MAVRSRVQPIDRDIALMLSADLSPAAQSSALASFAQAQLKDAQQINTQALGRVPRHETYVDGRRGADVATVRPGGSIIFEFELVSDVIEWIELLLVQHSPERSGRYSRSHVLFADGVEVQFGAAVPEAREYIFVNTQPYARKIEGGPGRPPQSKQAREGVYHVVAFLGSRRFANLAKIKFSFVVPQFGAIHDWASKTTLSKRGRRRARLRSEAEWLRRQPAIIVTV